MLRTRIAPHGLSVRLDDGRHAFVEREIGTEGAGLRELWAMALTGAEARGWTGRAQVCIADAFCWMDSLEGEFAAHPPRVADGMVRAALAEMLPEGGRDHELRWQLQGDGRHALVLAVPIPLLQAVHDAAGALGLRLASIDAEFVARWNLYGRRLGLREGIAAFAHRGAATLVRLRRGAITGLAFEQVGLSHEALEIAARRLASRFGDDTGGGGARALVSADNWNPERLGGWVLHRPPPPRQAWWPR